MNDIATAFEAAANAPTRRTGSEATKIEQSRAVAEVQAAIVVARQCPRDNARAIASMREACAIEQLAQRAFFKFPRGGQTITGASIHLARELARCWGNIDYGAKELSRDDFAGISEMLAFAWDLETNTRSETTFIVPHKRDKKGGAERLVDMRDIYENNANNAARRLRECIFSVLPIWFTEMAEDDCRATLANGGGEPMTVRTANAIDAFAKIGITKAQLEHKIGRPSNDWIGEDIADLQISYKSIKRGEIAKDEMFPRDINTLPANADGFEKASAGKKGDQAPEQYALVTETGEVAAFYELTDYLAAYEKNAGAIFATGKQAAMLNFDKANKPHIAKHEGLAAKIAEIDARVRKT